MNKKAMMKRKEKNDEIFLRKFDSKKREAKPPKKSNLIL